MSNEGFRVHIALPDTRPSEYEAVIAPGSIGRVPELLPAEASADRYVVVADAEVARLYGESLVRCLEEAGRPASLLAVPSGEPEKTRARWAEVTDALVERGVGRDGCIIALGGGVIGDLAGFVAATYMRGIPLVQVPTTLLAMLDASVGGKTGVDTPLGKNLVGVVRQPALVVMDPLVLRTLPLAELRSGLAEAVKHGAIASAGYLEWIESTGDRLLERQSNALAELIAWSVEIKASFVTRDPEEHGPRKALNFGHTIAHALESLSAYTLPHGHAVAIGMVVEARLGERLGVTREGSAGRLEQVLERLGLPVRIPGSVPAREILARTARDKKVRRARTRYSLIAEIGQSARSEQGDWSIAVDADAVLPVLAEAGADV
jgi:3-dehydroquinate synthase